MTDANKTTTQFIGELDGLRRRIAQLEVSEAEDKQAKESLRRMSKVFMDSADPIVIEDLEGKVIDLNTEAEHTYGWKREELLYKPIKNLVPVERHGQADELLELCKTGREVRNIEGLRCDKSGRVFPVLLTLSLLTGEDGIPIGIVSIAKDITELKQAGQKLLELNEELQQLNLSLEQKVKDRTSELEIATDEAKVANQSKSDFLASMSHELRTPLNAVIGFSQILQEQYFGKLNEKQVEYVADIHESGQHLLSLINDILDLSKIEAGKMELELSDVKIKELIENSLVMIKEKALVHGIRLDIHCSKELEGLKILADGRKLKQVMFNLLSNAAKFTPDGGSITIKGLKEGELLNISVEDTGIGLAPGDQEKVFGEFYQVRGSMTDKTPGTGLGLPLTRSIIEMHKGRIWVESDGANKGSRFTFNLPV